MKKTRVMFLLTVLVLVSSLAVCGYEKDKEKKTAHKGGGDIYSQVELFADAIGMLRNDYVSEVDSKKLIYGAMKGMLSSLDDYSQFLEPDEFNEMKVETKGEFGGIGVEVSLREGIITIITPMVDSPAEAAGLRALDKIVRIDGKTTKNMTLADAVKKMRGKAGTELTLTIWREKEDKVFDVKIKRAVIKMKSIKTSEILQDKTGYIKLVEFQEHTARDLEAALKKLESLGMDGLILDLRNNPGGLLEGAVEVAEKFLVKDKPIVSIKGRKNAGNDMEFKSSGKDVHPDYPLIVMVNEGSASASEIVAGAIQDNKRGLILGAKTFGKASVQTVIPMKDSSAIRFTTAYYFTPNGRMIKDGGIIPDVAVERQEYKESRPSSPEDVFEKLEEKDKAPEKTPPAPDILKKDSQLQEALSLMKVIKIYRAR